MEVASLGLLLLDGLEESLEISSAKSIVIASLNDFNEKRGAILQWLGKYLKQITLIIEVYQNVQFSNHLQVFLDLGTCVAESLGKVIVVGRWDGQELASSILHACHRIDDVVRSQSDVLDTGTSVVIDVLLDLRFSLACGWLVDGHLDILVEVRDNHGAEGRKLCVKHFIID